MIKNHETINLIDLLSKLIKQEFTGETQKEMKDVFEVFDGVKNADFKELQYVEGLTDQVPVFTLVEPTAEEWNRKARIQNTKMFVEVFGRLPQSYEEVAAWARNGAVHEENQPTGNELAFT